MNSIESISPVRPPKIPLVISIVFSLLCTQIPLFNYLGFEFSALTALVVGFLAGMATISLWKSHERVLETNQEGNHDPDEMLWRFLVSLALFLSLLCLMPILILSLNALFVKNCSLPQGLLYYALLVVPGVLFCSMLALLIAVSVARWNKTLFLFIYATLLLQIFYVTISRPQIFAFNPIVGFFPGITYDESLRIENRLVLYRWVTVSASVLMFIAAVGIHRRRIREKLHREAPQVFYRLERIGAVVLILIVAGAYFFSEELGFASTEHSLEAQLGGKVETEHFIIVYPTRAVTEAQARQLGLLHEFYFAKLAQELRVVSIRKIRSFLYASPEQKGRLIGAARTNIAKPWLWQIHLNLGDVEGSLKHELVHVMAAEFGFPMFRVGLNPGLIEGLATAVERVQNDELLHRVAAQIFSVNINPNMQSLFSFVGFAQAHPGVSYSLAGSFCRFLIDFYGMRRFKRLYRTGDFRGVYNRDITLLLSEWKSHLERYRLEGGERQKAAYLFRRSSIFGKECARVIANINAETRQYYDRGEYQLALASANHSLELSRSPEAILQRMNALLKLQQYTEASEFAEESLHDSMIAHSLLPLKLHLGDAYWAQGDLDDAKETYAELLKTHLSLNMDEACLLRLEVLRDSSIAGDLRAYFTGQMVDSTRISFLQASLRSGKHTDLTTYLLAREYAARGAERRAIELLLPIERMNSDLLELQRQLRLARMHFALGEFQRAKIHFWQSQNYTSSEAVQLRTREWLDRCDWMTNPPALLFKTKEDEWESLWNGDNHCNCPPYRASFLPVIPN